MKYIKFYNPYFYANRDENSDLAYNELTRRFNSHCCNQELASNITENEDEYRIEMALPGVDKNNIRINHEKGLLTVNVEKPQNEENQKYNHFEFDYSGSSRVFRIGEKVDAEKITAKYENGILIISLPKKEVEKKIVKLIEVQ